MKNIDHDEHLVRMHAMARFIISSPIANATCVIAYWPTCIPTLHMLHHGQSCRDSRKAVMVSNRGFRR